MNPPVQLGDVVNIRGRLWRVFGCRYDGGCDWWIVLGEPLSGANRHPEGEVIVMPYEVIVR